MPEFNELLKKGDIVTALFPRREGPAMQARPCLILEATNDELLIAYGTTSTSVSNRGLDLSVSEDLEAHGLHRATRFVCARRLRLARTDDRLVADRHGRLLVGSLGKQFRPCLDDILDALAAEGPRDEREARERKGIHPGPRRSYLRRNRRHAKGGMGQHSGTAARNVVVVTRPAPRHRAKESVGNSLHRSSEAHHAHGK